MIDTMSLVGEVEEIEKVLGKYERIFGAVPKLYAEIAEQAPNLLLVLDQIECRLNYSSFTSEEKQILMLYCSLLNDSNVCISFHSEMLNLQGMSSENHELVLSGKLPKDPRLASLVKVAEGLWRNRGKLTQDDISQFENQGYDRKQIFDIIHIISLKTISNFCVNMLISFEE